MTAQINRINGSLYNFDDFRSEDRVYEKAPRRSLADFLLDLVARALGCGGK